MNARREDPHHAGGSDVGRIRSGNEDAYLISPPLYAVADGLGGHSAGEVASRIAVETLQNAAPRHADAKALGRAVRQANTAVITAAENGRGRAGMGTTMTAAVVEGTRIVIAHVGDSRAYLLHLGELQQITDDHSMVADMVRRGTLSLEESRHHPNRSVITRALGSDPNLVVDTFEVDAAPGDRLLLCTDGLTGMVDDPLISRVLAGSHTPRLAVESLVGYANDAGGQDNITVVVVDIERGPGDPGLPAAAADARSAERGAARRWIARILWVLLAAALIGGAAWAAYSYARGQAYLIEESGVIVVYEGVPGDFAGIELHWRSEATTVTTDALDPITAARLKAGVRTDSLQDAQALLQQYRARAEESFAATPTPTPSTP
ncbi:MAG: Stp1/IreP family PP2C-type Ser/Thr phosphatase [Coriobacteriia bacterium]|nr:Stp1/IreP family PP2C-type Ser/Thr phosphatase [Coriobacteriia bacterium]